jgi:hypothetical protein
MNQQLRLTAQRTTNTLPDVQYQQVVDNLATTAWNPHFLPYLAVAGQGLIQVTDNGNTSLGFSFLPGTFAPELFSVGGSRNVTGTWSMGTITNPEKIRAMQALYQRAVDGTTRGDPSYAWLNVGCRRDVPKQAVFVGRHGQVFVWVMPGGIAGLSELTLAIMDIATRADAGAASAQPPGIMHQLLAPPPISRRNFQVPPTGPVFTPGAG